MPACRIYTNNGLGEKFGQKYKGGRRMMKNEKSGCNHKSVGIGTSGCIG